jgi:hypothetical protein
VGHYVRGSRAMANMALDRQSQEVEIGRLAWISTKRDRHKRRGMVVSTGEVRTRGALDDAELDAGLIGR